MSEETRNVNCNIPVKLWERLMDLKRDRKIKTIKQGIIEALHVYLSEKEKY